MARDLKLAQRVASTRRKRRAKRARLFLAYLIGLGNRRYGNIEKLLLGERLPRRLCPLAPVTRPGLRLGGFRHGLRGRLSTREPRDRGSAATEGDPAAQRGGVPPNNRFSAGQ